MTPDDVRDRLEGWGFGPDDDLSHLHYASLPALDPLDTNGGGRELVAAAELLGVAFLVIDTTARAVQGEENVADTYKDFDRHTGAALKRRGIAWLRVDHAGKDQTKGQRGSSAKNDDVDVVLQVNRTDNGVAVRATHRRMGWYPERVELEHVIAPDGVESLVFTGGPGWPKGTEECAADLDRLDVPLDASKRTTADMLRAAGKGRRDAVVRAAMKYRRTHSELTLFGPGSGSQMAGSTPTDDDGGQLGSQSTEVPE
jgi:hypothetical protein